MTLRPREPKCKKKLELKKMFFLSVITNKFIEYDYHCVRSVGIRSVSCPHFPAFEQNMEISTYQSEYGKIRTRKSPNTDTFHSVYVLMKTDASWVTLGKKNHFLLREYRKET